MHRGGSLTGPSNGNRPACNAQVHTSPHGPCKPVLIVTSENKNSQVYIRAESLVQLPTRATPATNAGDGGYSVGHVHRVQSRAGRAVGGRPRENEEGNLDR